MNFVQYKDIKGKKLCIICEGYNKLYDETLLKGISYYFLPNYTVCMHLKVLYKMIIILDYYHVTMLVFNDIKKAIIYLYVKHLEAILFTTNTSVALSMDESNIIFHTLSKSNLNTAFFCIQNNYYGHYTKWDVLEHYPDRRYFNFTNLFCIGRETERSFREHGHNVDNYIIAGTLISSYYWNNVSIQIKNKKYDICVISEWEKFMVKTGYNFDYDKNQENIKIKQLRIRMTYGVLGLLRLIKDLSLEGKYRIIIALRHDNACDEVEFYDSYFNNSVTLQESNRQNYSTYQTIDKSELTVHLSSTCGFEALSAGKKVLFCNYNNDYRFDYNLHNVNKYAGNNVFNFKSAVETLLSYDISVYKKISYEQNQNYIYFNKEFSHVDIIKDTLSSYLN